jgi:hypothetical protein
MGWPRHRILTPFLISFFLLLVIQQGQGQPSSVSSGAGMTARGRVRAQAGAGLAGYTVSAVTLLGDGSTFVSEARSGWDGSFVLLGLPAGTYSLFVDDPVGGRYWTDDPSDPVSANNAALVIREGVNVDGITLIGAVPQAVQRDLRPSSPLAARAAGAATGAASAAAPPTFTCPTCDASISGVGGMEFARDGVRHVADPATIDNCRGDDKAGCTRTNWLAPVRVPCGANPRRVDVTSTIDAHAATWNGFPFHSDPPPCGLPCHAGAYTYCHMMSHECAHEDANEAQLKALYVTYMQTLERATGCTACSCQFKEEAEKKAFDTFSARANALNTEPQAQEADCNWLQHNCVARTPPTPPPGNP